MNYNRYTVVKCVIHLLAIAQGVSVQPEGCICPTESYWCRADLVSGIAIENSALSEPFTYAIDLFVRPQIMRDGLRISFSEERVENGLVNMTTQLFIIDIQTWNGSIFSCQASGGGNKNIPVCVTGKIVSVFVVTL